MTRSYILSHIKSAVVPSGKRIRTIPLGLFRGQRMEIDLRTDMQFYLGLNEFELAQWVRRLSRGIRTAVDVGCREGYYTVYFKKHTDARVIALDCDPAAERLLRHSLSLNKTEVEFRLGEISDHNPLDTVLPIEYPAVVKMDIEGWDGIAIRSAPRLLAEDVRWIVETHSEAVEAECLSLFQDAGVTAQVIPNAWWRALLPERRPGFCEHNRWIVAARDLC